MTDITLKTAYLAARKTPAPSFAKQGYKARQYDGTARPLSPQEEESRAARYPHDGIGLAAYALITARRNMAEYEAAQETYTAAGAAVESARLESNEAKQAAQSLARAGGPEYEAAAQGVTWAAGAYEAARAAVETARKKAARARSRVAYYGGGNYVGTWQSKPGHFFADDPDSLFRNVTPAHEAARLNHMGYYDNLFNESFRDGDGLVIGYIAQLSGRDGAARYVAGYQFGGSDGDGITFDMSEIFESPGDDCEEARRDAARAADSMAESAAESEREYQTAWQAGRDWRDTQAEIETAESGIKESRAAIMAAARERKQAAARADSYPALCDAIRGHILTLYHGIVAARAEIEEAREKQETLAAGDFDYLIFYPGEERLRAAFCEGADLDGFPA